MIGTLRFSIPFLAGLLVASGATAQVYQWEYVDPSDPAQGKQQSAVFAPDGAGVDLTDIGGLLGRDLTMAYLPGRDLKQYLVGTTVLDNAYLAGADLYNLQGQGLVARGADFSSTNLDSALLQSSDLSGADLRNANLTGATLAGADFTGASVASAVFTQSDLTSAQLYSTASYQSGELGRVDMTYMDLAGWDFSGVSMRLARLNGADLSGVVFDGANLSNAFLGRFPDESVGTSFRNATLTDANFNANGRWRNADFTGANLEDADLGNNGFVDSDFADAVVRGADLSYVTNWGFTLANLYETASYKTGDLTGVNLNNNNLTGADFRGVDLSGAQLGSSDLDGADFRGATAVGAMFSGSMDGVDFGGAVLQESRFGYDSTTGISFRGADLSYAKFEHATMVGVDLSDAVIYGVSLENPNGLFPITAQQFYSTASYKSGVLGPVRLRGDFAGWDFRGQDLTGAYFGRDSRLDGTQWGGATLDGATFFVNSMADTDFRSTGLRGAEFVASDLDRADFRGVDLDGAKFSETSVVDGRFEGASWRMGAAVNSDLTRASLVGVDLRGTRLVSTTLTDADFTDADIRDAEFQPDAGTLVFAQLKQSKSYGERDLTGVTLTTIDLTGESFVGFKMPRFEASDSDVSDADFAGANLREAAFAVVNLANASFRGADLTGAYFSNAANLASVDFTDAEINGLYLRNGGITADQLYSTRSYKQRNLGPINLNDTDLTGWDLRGQDLRGAGLASQTFDGAEYQLADLRAATLPTAPRSSEWQTGDADLSRTILPDGRMEWLRIGAGETLTLKNAPLSEDGTVAVEDILVIRGADIEEGATLTAVFDADSWESTFLFQRVPIQIGGVLELSFASDVDLLSQVGRSFRLFDWAPVAVNGQFDVQSDPGLTWDLSQLYSGGLVTLVAAVPEPSAFLLFALGACGSAASRRRRSND